MSGVLTGRVALVTGGAQGIGRAVAEALDAVGCHILVADADPAAASATVKTLGNRAGTWVGDLVELAAAEAVVQTTIDQFGRLDVVVNDAGYSRNALIEDMPEKLFREMLDIHMVVP